MTAMTETAETEEPDPETADHYDAIVIGAGLSGLHLLYRLRERGLRVRLLEAGGGVGGTWYWNRYPGARLDSESYTYQYNFTPDLLEKWDWSELFVAQPELERYYNEFVDSRDLRKDIQLNTRVSAMRFLEGENNWLITIDGGRPFTTHLVITATGIMSAPNFPDIPDRDKFTGEIYHTALWPQHDVTFRGKRVIVIGTGASGVQVISEIAKDVGHLTVFQRTPNWAVPLRNRPLGADEMAQIRASYPEMFQRLANAYGGFLHSWDPKPTGAYTVDELTAVYEKAWASPGFAKWFGLPANIATDAEANQVYCNFLADKIRSRVDDPAVAEKLIPKHLFGTKRVPCETNYYEVYNRENVDLELLSENSILGFTPNGVKTAKGQYQADMIVLATGFDAFAGALRRIDVQGVGDIRLIDKWSDGPLTYLGVQVAGFPNMFIMGGPHGKGGHGNSPRCGEAQIEWLCAVAQKITDEDIVRWEADARHEKEWTDQVNDAAEHTLQARTASYFFGQNIADGGRHYLAYVGSLPEFVARLHGLAAEGYPGFNITPGAKTTGIS